MHSLNRRLRHLADKLTRVERHALEEGDERQPTVSQLSSAALLRTHKLRRACPLSLRARSPRPTEMTSAEHIGRDMQMHVGNQYEKVPAPLRDSDAGDDAARAACRAT